MLVKGTHTTYLDLVVSGIKRRNMDQCISFRHLTASSIRSGSDMVMLGVQPVTCSIWQFGFLVARRRKSSKGVDQHGVFAIPRLKWT